MRIAFVGDVHGCVYHCLAALVRLHRDKPLDAVIQVGDLGAWPDRDRMFELDPASAWFAEDNPAQLDWFDLLDPATELAPAIRAAREELGRPILFIRGNHDDAHWLRGLELDGLAAPADPFDVFHFVPDASVLQVGELRIGFLGGIECDPTWPDAVRRA
ncbi:MAG: metallophosphoesterase, partial [Gammaproteobacteria bacterium]